jgi:hypothetical protein
MLFTLNKNNYWPDDGGFIFKHVDVNRIIWPNRSQRRSKFSGEPFLTYLHPSSLLFSFLLSLSLLYLFRTIFCYVTSLFFRWCSFELRSATFFSTWKLLRREVDMIYIYRHKPFRVLFISMYTVTNILGNDSVNKPATYTQTPIE